MAISTEKPSAAKKKPVKRKPAKKKAASKTKAKTRTKAKPASRTKALAKRRAIEAVSEPPEATVDEPLVLERTIPSVNVAPDTFTTRSVTGVRAKDITNFLRQLIMMLDSGTPILKALHSLAQRGESKGIRNIVAGIAEYVESGNPLWQAFAREGKYFSPMFINLVKAAEASGTLTTVLRRLVDFQEQRARLKKYIQVAMIYPTILVAVCLAVLVLLSLVVLPEFREIFESMDVTLNWYSEFVMDSADFVAQFWWLGVLAVIGVIVAYQFWWIRNPLRRLAADQLKLRLPIFGFIIQRGLVADFLRTFAMLLRSGISMMATLDLCKNSMSNRAYVNAIQDMRDSVESGEGLEAPLRAAERKGYIPGIVVDMMITGEETGSLDKVADQVAQTYEEEVEVAADALKEAITPAFVVIMGFAVGSIVIAMFLPLIGMIENISGGAL